MHSLYVKESFSYWTTHADDTTPADVLHLQEATRLYPYCQTLHLLTAKAVAMHQPDQMNQTLQVAAAHALSRSALRRLVQNEFDWAEHLLDQKSGLVWPSEYHQKESKPWQLPELPQLSTVYENQISQLIAPEERPPIDDTAIRENTLQSELAQIAEQFKADPVPNWQGLERQRQMDIIDSYIENEARMGPIRANLKDANADPEDLTKSRNATASSQGVVSEGMAKIMVRQGRIERAIEIYEQLILKKPEKKAYFAEKIKELTTEWK